MIVKIVKIYLTLSLMLWAVWGQFHGGSLCLTSSVCWSLQCLISILTQGRWWWTLFFYFFLGSLIQSRCGEEEMLQTNNTVVCTQCLSPAGPVPARGAQTAGPSESAPLRATRVPEPERLRPGRRMQPRAGLRRFPAEQPRA